MSGTNADLLVAESKSGKEDGLYAFSPNLTRPVTLERERTHNKVLFCKDLVVENGDTAKEPKMVPNTSSISPLPSRLLQFL